MGEKGETPHGRVDEAAAARGPGTVTTAETTDSVSLATPVSGPQQLVKLLLPSLLLESTIPPSLIKPPPRLVESNTRPKWTPPHVNESCGKGQQAVDDDEDCRAHECVDDPLAAHGADTSMDETAAIATASMSTDAAAPHHKPSAPLEGKQRGRETTGETGADDDHAEATQDQGDQATTSASAQVRPSEDLADATDDEEHHPDEPTKPPDKPEGMARHGDKRSVEGVQLRELRVSRVSMEGAQTTDDGDDDTVKMHRPTKPKDPPDDVEVEPGGETKARRCGSVAHEDVDADVDWDVGEARRDAQVKRESAGMRREVSIERERGSASAHERSTTTVEDTDQHPSTDDDDVPGIPPTPPEPLDEAVQRTDEPLSVELEGEWNDLASCDVGPTRVEADATGVLGGEDDSMNRPKGAQNTSERAQERSRRRPREHPP